jgi:hypothetical protein
MKTGHKKFGKKRLVHNNDGDMNMILTAVVMAIVFSIGIIIVFNVIASVDDDTIDADLDGTPAANATDNLVSNLETFYVVGPIALIVVAAVGILSYILLLRRR